MLEARRVSLWRNRYEVVVDDRPLATWDGRVRRNGGTFDLAERRYDVKSTGEPAIPFIGVGGLL